MIEENCLASGTLVKRLLTHRTLQAAPRDEMEWVAAHGLLRRIGAREILTRKEGPVEGLHIVLDGHLTLHVDSGVGPKKVMEWHGGDVTGVLPYSRIVAPPADIVAQEPTELVTVYRKDLANLVRECPELTGILVHAMIDRARHVTSSFLHDEKLVSLGKLSAGLAHELNNPVSAIARNSDIMSSQLKDLESTSRSLGTAGLTDAQFRRLNELCDSAFRDPFQTIRSPLEQEQWEESINGWLRGRKIDVEMAEALAEVPVTLEMMESVAETVEEQTLEQALRWIVAALAVRRLNSEMREASLRVVDLVAAVKEFTHMDRGALLEEVDIQRGLSNTLAVLGAKAKQKSVALQVNIDPDLPAVRGSAGELNQVWSNLIDNALDAVDERGHVHVVARLEGKTVVVRVVDDGPGIPSDIRERIFDPFFTTKPVGAGTGLGLDIVRRLIKRHGGLIEMECGDEGTEFRVRLPAASADTRGLNT